jgi:hypothetical protein
MALSRLVTTGVVALAATVATGQAQASLVSPVSVSLFAPGGISGVPGAISVTDVVNTATGIVVGDASQIGSNYMLPGESILFSGNSILLHVAAGFQAPNNDLLTGYLGAGGVHARYVFDGLAIAGKTIIGANIQALTGVISGTDGGLTGVGEVSFNLDDLKFTNLGTGTGNAFGEFRIDLVLQDTVNPPPQVPEPAGWALALAALVALRFTSRRPAA